MLRASKIKAAIFEGSLAVPGGENLAIKPITDEDAILLGGTGYLPYVFLGGSSNKFVKAEKFPINRIGLAQGENLTDLDKEFVCCVIAGRTKAIAYKPAIRAYFDASNPEFRKIVELSQVKDSNAQAGLEFLIWIPKVGEGGTLATLFCGTKTLQKIALPLRDACKPAMVDGEMRPQMGTVKCTLKKIDNGTYQWLGLTVVKSTEPIGVMPDASDLAAALQKFQNPVSSQVESAPESADRKR